MLHHYIYLFILKQKANVKVNEFMHKEDTPTLKGGISDQFIQHSITWMYNADDRDFKWCSRLCIATMTKLQKLGYPKVCAKCTMKPYSKICTVCAAWEKKTNLIMGVPAST